MKRFYECHLLAFANKHSCYLQIMKHFLYPDWKTVNENGIQKTNIVNEYLVLSMKQNSGLFYVVNSEYEICSYPVGMSGAPCKHQGAVSIKFYISMFNFVSSLMPDNRITYTYIAISK